MMLRKEIIDLINDEQSRQLGKFVPDGNEYFKKLAKNAELLSHESHGVCLGFVFFYCNNPNKYSSYITLLMVSPEARMLGIGSALTKYVFDLTKKRGFKVCRLEVLKENSAAIKLYESMGFSTIEDHGDKYLMEAQTS